LKSALDDNKIKSLIHLLEDEDISTYELIYSQIIEIGAELMPYLLDAEDNSVNPLLSYRLKELYQKLNLQKSIKELESWKNNNSRNLYQGLGILAKFQYPRLELKKVSEIVNKIRQDLWLEVNDNLTALEKVRILNHLFFNVYNFKGDIKDYHNPENSFISDVLMRKKGNPLNLSAIYSIIAQSVNIPIYGVNMPRNYMLVYVEKLYSQPIEKVKSNDVLFYINPFNNGEIYSLNDVMKYLRNINIEPNKKYYLPCSNITTIQRSINNLINIYSNKGNDQKADEFKMLFEALRD